MGSVFQSIVLPRLAARLGGARVAVPFAPLSTAAAAQSSSSAITPNEASAVEVFPGWSGSASAGASKGSSVSAEAFRSSAAAGNPTNFSGTSLGPYIPFTSDPSNEPTLFKATTSRERTKALALERIITSFRQPGPSRGKPPFSAHLTAETSNYFRSLLTPFPPTIQQCLAARNYRLAVFHLLRTPEYAVDPSLMNRVAQHLEENGAGRLARRLRRGWDNDGWWRPRGGAAQVESGAGGLTGLGIGATLGVRTLEEPPKRGRLRSDPEPGPGRPRKPPDHWRHLTTLSVPPSMSTLPPDLPPEIRQAELTRYHNHVLSAFGRERWRGPNLGTGSSSSSSRSSSPASPLNQLRQLLGRISRLEQHRGFKPDRVTANIVVRCLVACATSGGGMTTQREKGRRNGHASLAKAQGEAASGRDPSEAMRVDELWLVFELVRRLYEEVGEVAATISPNAMTSLSSMTPPIASPTQVQLLSAESNAQASAQHYRHHVRPFGMMMSKAFRRIGEPEAARRVVAWHLGQRERLDPASGSVMAKRRAASEILLTGVEERDAMKAESAREGVD